MIWKYLYRKGPKLGEFTLKRCISCGEISLKNSSSSSRWMKRHLSDPYIKSAAKDDYRCRSAYKLLELDDKFHFLRRGKTVIDCGASPGSWTQVAVQKVCPASKQGMGFNASQGMVIGVDLLDIKDIPGAKLLSGYDFTMKETQEKILRLLPENSADIILSDMAPNSAGNHSLDHDAILELAEIVYHFSKNVLVKGGTFVCKLWDGRGTQDFMQNIQVNFSRVKKYKPKASRKESAEIYVFADGFTQ